MSNEELLKRVAACFERHADGSLNDSMWLPVDVEERVAALCAEVERETLERAAEAICFFCRHGETPYLEGIDWIHGENNKCAAHSIRALKVEK